MKLDQNFEVKIAQLSRPPNGIVQITFKKLPVKALFLVLLIKFVTQVLDPKCLNAESIFCHI